MVSITLDQVASELGRYQFRPKDEAELQRQVAAVLRDAGITVELEVRSGAGRYDLLLPGGLVVELKVRGSAAEVDRQAQRYAAADGVSAVVVATTSSRLAFELRRPGATTLGGKPFRVIHLRSI